MQNDIADLKRVVQHESKMCGMAAGKLEAIRHSLRRYERMVKKPAEDKVYGADNLYNRIIEPRYEISLNGIRGQS